VNFRLTATERPAIGQLERTERTQAPTTKGAHSPWLDSSLDLQRGLDVTELTLEDLARVLRQPTRHPR